MGIRYVKQLVLEPEIVEEAKHDSFQSEAVPVILDGYFRQALKEFVYGEHMVIHVIFTDGEEADTMPEYTFLKDYHDIINDVLNERKKEEK